MAAATTIATSTGEVRSDDATAAREKGAYDEVIRSPARDDCAGILQWLGCRPHGSARTCVDGRASSHDARIDRGTRRPRAGEQASHSSSHGPAALGIPRNDDFSYESSSTGLELNAPIRQLACDDARGSAHRTTDRGTARCAGDCTSGPDDIDWDGRMRAVLLLAAVRGSRSLRSLSGARPMARSPPAS